MPKGFDWWQRRWTNIPIFTNQHTFVQLVMHDVELQFCFGLNLPNSFQCNWIHQEIIVRAFVHPLIYCLLIYWLIDWCFITNLVNGCLYWSLEFNATLTARVISWQSVTHVFPGLLTPVLTQLFFPKLPTTFLVYFFRGERWKYAGKKVRLNRGSNPQSPGHESNTLTTEPPGRGQFSNNKTLAHMFTYVRCFTSTRLELWYILPKDTPTKKKTSLERGI